MKTLNLFMLLSTKFKISALIVLLVMITNIRFAYSQEWKIVNPTNPPPAAMGHILIALPDGRILCVSGVEDIYNDLFAYENGEWNGPLSTTTPPPPKRTHCGSWSGNGKLYINGGIKNTPPFCLDDTWNYDVATGEWSKISTTNTPAARYDHKANEHPDGYVLISGGTNENGDHLKDIFKFDPVTNQFTLLSEADFAISGHVSEIVDNKLYILSENNLAQIYDISNNTWTSNQQGPPIKQGATSAVGANDIGQKIVFVFGGIGNNGLITNTVYEYNTVTNTTTLRSTPIPQSIAKGASATITGGLKNYAYLKVIYFGGINGMDQIVNTTMEFTIGTPSGFNENSINNNITIYPNPASECILIKADENLIINQEFNYVVYNELGEKTKIGKIVSSEQIIDIADLTDGIYFLHFPQNNYKIKFIKKE